VANVSTTESSLKLEFPAELPISAHVEEISELLAEHQVIVVAGETGSGKTTQLPKICLAAGLGGDTETMIVHTQPRRLAARSVAARIADELEVVVGEEVGYAVRFSDRTSAQTRIKLVTDGLLLTEIRHDRMLSKYQVVIVDEAHERSLNVDFLLGYLKRLTARRKDLKIIITSATIDVAAFARHFDDAPVVEVGGRTYPVTVNYLEPGTSDEEMTPALIEALEDIETSPQARARDVLVFFPGEREILEAARTLRREIGDRMEILPLYARLSNKDQQRVFHPGKLRRIILATNVAETSLTVPNIGYVIDTGTARISRYSFRSKLQRLPIEAISQASANQRAGRCGRIAPGVCYRLYGEDDFNGRPLYTDPEIKRTNLASVVLQMRAFRLGDPLRFPFLEPPDPKAIRDADRLLEELGAIHDSTLTAVGRTMARLPIDPRLARMLVAADAERSLSEVLVIASALAIADPRERPLEKQGSADRAHEQWVDERSDFVALMNLWNWHEQARQDLTKSRLRRELSKRFLSASRMREWRELHRQLLLATRDLKMRLNSAPADYSSVHKALLAGSLSLIGQHDERGEYLGPRNLRFRIFPGSGLASKKPKWLLAGEIVETRRVYARSVAAVEARWIEEAAAHLVRRRHSEPYWSIKRGETQAYETVTLYGLVLADRRVISFSRIDPLASRSLFLLDGLARGAVKDPPEFLDHNLKCIAGIREQEDKGRRRDLLKDDLDIAALYDERIPSDISNVRALRRWLKRASAEEAAGLFFTTALLSRESGSGYGEDDYPSHLPLRGVEVELKYRFAPGQPDDGVSVRVPVGALSAVVSEQLEWSVPGMFPGVCEQWLRSLPKQHRRRLGPIPDAVRQLLPVLLTQSIYRQGRLAVALTKALSAEFAVIVAADDWHPERIDDQWRVNVQLIDGNGAVVDQGRDVKALQARHASNAADRVSQEGASLEDSRLADFPEQLPQTVTLGEGAETAVVYPTLVDEAGHVALRLLASPVQQRQLNRHGYARLALEKLSQTVRYLKKQPIRSRELGLLFSPLGGAEKLTDELLLAASWQCFFEGRGLPDTAEDFARRLDEHRSELAERFDRLQSQLLEILQVRQQLVAVLEASSSPAYVAAVADIRAQLDDLVGEDVLSQTPGDVVAELPRYLRAAIYRLEHLQGRVTRDAQIQQTITSLSERVERLRQHDSVEFEDWQKYRFLLEEVRVGEYAEVMGVRGKSSIKRFDRDLGALERDLGLI
jgi:ATP-dependent helicase HrpA